MSDVNSTIVNTSGQKTHKSRLAVIHETTLDSLRNMTAVELKDPEYVESKILNDVHLAIELENTGRAS